MRGDFVGGDSESLEFRFSMVTVTDFLSLVAILQLDAVHAVELWRIRMEWAEEVEVCRCVGV